MGDGEDGGYGEDGGDGGDGEDGEDGGENGSIIPYSLFPVPCSLVQTTKNPEQTTLLFTVYCSLFPVPYFTNNQQQTTNNQQPKMTDNPQSIADRKEHANAIGGPFGIILNPLGDIAVTAGESCDLSITIINDADKTPLVNIFVDETSQPVRDWCVIPEQRLALGVGQSSEITFQFEIPIETASGSYEFVVVIDAPDHYPEDTPILLQQRIQVLPYVQEARLASDPTFTLQPPTRSDQPIPLQQGQPLELAVLVDNRSDRVDRFRLLCPDLDRDWYQIIYEDDFSLGGLIMGEQYLELNPGEQGVIRLIITPPLNTPAGVYTPTVSLKSLNNPDLVLLDVVYLQILPVYLLTAELVTLVGRIRRQNAAFTLFLKNQGNTPRSLHIAVAGADEDTTCRYTVEPEAIDIAPTGSGAIAIEVAPLKRWKRPFYTKVIDFNIRLRDPEGHPLPNEVFPGSVVWDGRPWWQFLILVLLAIGAIGTLIFLIWLFFPRPPSPPEILEFSPQSSFYEEENGEAVRLNWQLSNPNRLKTITVQGVSPQGLVISRPVEYDMTQGIPEALADFCQIETILICINVPTDARKPGDYIFKLTAAPIPQRRSGLFGRLLSRIWRTRRSPVSLETNIVRIDATPTPEVLAFSPTQPNYTFSLAPDLPPATETTPQDPEEAEEDRDPASSLQLPSASPEEAPDQPQAIPPVALNPPEDPNPDEPEQTVQLNWTISNPLRLKALKLVGRAPDDTIVKPETTYDFSLGIPEELQDACRIQQRQLRCTQVDTGVGEEGTYIFELIPISNLTNATPPDPTKTDPIKVTVEAPPLEITDFTINGTQALPKYVLQVNPNQPPLLLDLGWTVRGGKEVTVSLQPAPGTVPPQGTISYPLSQEAGTELITLTATSSEGEEVSRSVTIDKLTPEEAQVPPRVEEAVPAVPQPTPEPQPQQQDQAAPPSEPPSEEAPPLPVPPSGAPPVPPGRNAPPPSDLPPVLY